MKKLLLSAAIVCTAILGAQAQTGYHESDFLSSPGNPGGINTDVDFTLTNNFITPGGVTKLIGDDKNVPKFSTVQTLPFAFNFNGGPVTKFRVSSAGFLTFSTSNPANTHTNVALPSASIPDSSVCVWGLCTAGLGLSGEVYTKVYGTAPHRQLWSVWFAATNTVDTSSIAFWAIVLEEGTNNIYVVDESSTYRWNNVPSYTMANLTVGIQVNGTAYQVSASPNVQSKVTNNSSGTNTLNDYYEFSPGTRNAYDALVVGTSITNQIYYGVGSSNPVSGTIANLGSTALTGLDLNWQMSGGPVKTNTASVSIAAPNPVSEGVANSTFNWTPATPGTYTLKVWATNLNGSNPNADPNDTLTVNNIQVIDTVATKMVLFEEFMQASCNPCMYAAPNMASVLSSSKNICNDIHYHVNWPGTDYMNTQTQTPFVNARVGYYSVSGVPDAKIDGTTDVFPGSFSQTDLLNAQTPGSPITITFTSCTYTPATKTYAASVKIHSYANLPATTAQAALTVDTITYLADQSTEDPVSSFAPPLGSGTNPDNLFQYVMAFPYVVEDMMPSSNGTALASFTAGQTQILNVSWVKNRPWGYAPKTYKYDSLPCHITVWVQSAGKYVYQSASAPTVGDPSGIQEQIATGVYFEMYPNPANNNTNIAFKLEQAQEVNVQMYNMLGEKVYDVNNGRMPAGDHQMTINTGNLQSGIYFVKFTTDNVTTTRKLVIQK